MKSFLFVIANEAIEFFGRSLRLNIYGVSPIIEAGTISPSLLTWPCPEIQINTGNRIDWRWEYNHFTEFVTAGGTTVLHARDNRGNMKAFEHDGTGDTGEFLINSGWAISIEHNGAVVYHGPRDDPRGEVAIIVPLGWSLENNAGDITVSQTYPLTIGGDEVNWEQDEAGPINYYLIFTDVVNANLIRGEIGLYWDDVTGGPVVKTSDDRVRRIGYTLKEFAYMMYSNCEELLEPLESVEGQAGGADQWLLNRALLQIDYLKDRYSSDPTLFDDYRNPDEIP